MATARAVDAPSATYCRRLRQKRRRRLINAAFTAHRRHYTADATLLAAVARESVASASPRLLHYAVLPPLSPDAVAADVFAATPLSPDAATSVAVYSAIIRCRLTLSRY